MIDYNWNKCYEIISELFTKNNGPYTINKAVNIEGHHIGLWQNTQKHRF